jgi:hypothetical protein
MNSKKVPKYLCGMERLGRRSIQYLLSLYQIEAGTLTDKGQYETYIKHTSTDSLFATFAKILITPCRAAKEAPIVHD